MLQKRYVLDTNVYGELLIEFNSKNGLIDSKTKKYSEDDLEADFQIIVVASLKGVDVVVSTDKRTILSKLAEDTYTIINKANGLSTPKLVKYSDFKSRYIK